MKRNKLTMSAMQEKINAQFEQLGNVNEALQATNDELLDYLEESPLWVLNSYDKKRVVRAIRRELIEIQEQRKTKIVDSAYQL